MSSNKGSAPFFSLAENAKAQRVATSLQIARNLLAPLKQKDFKLKRSKKLAASFQATRIPLRSPRNFAPLREKKRNLPFSLAENAKERKGAKGGD